MIPNKAWNSYWAQFSTEIKKVDNLLFQGILKRGRFMNDCIPFLADIENFITNFDAKFPTGTPLLGHREDKLPREFTIVWSDVYEKLSIALNDYWSNSIFWDISSPGKPLPQDYKSLKDLVLSNKKILPISTIWLLRVKTNQSCGDAKMESIKLWKQSLQSNLYSEVPHYKNLVSVDIKEFYKSIYVHWIEWAVTGDKKFCKDNKSSDDYKKKTVSWRLNLALMRFQDWQTNGIFVWNFASDFIAETILCRVVDSLEKNHLEKDFIWVRYKDDFKILCKTDEDAHDLLKDLHRLLRDFDLLAQEKDEQYISNGFSSLLFKKWKPEFLSIVRNGNRKEELLSTLYRIEDSPSATRGGFWYEFGKFIRPFYRMKSSVKKIVISWLIQWLKAHPNGTLIEMEYIYSLLLSIKDREYTRRILFSMVDFITLNHKNTWWHNLIVWFAFYLSLISKKWLLIESDINELTVRCSNSNEFVEFVITFLKTKSISSLKKLRRRPVDSYY